MLKLLLWSPTNRLADFLAYPCAPFKVQRASVQLPVTAESWVCVLRWESIRGKQLSCQHLLCSHIGHAGDDPAVPVHASLRARSQWPQCATGSGLKLCRFCYISQYNFLISVCNSCSPLFSLTGVFQQYNALFILSWPLKRVLPSALATLSTLINID